MTQSPNLFDLLAGASPDMQALLQASGDDRLLPPPQGFALIAAGGALPNLRLGPCVGDDEVVVSDARLKEDIRQIGSTVHGLPLYSFHYLGAPEVFAGVMAQDVLEVMPDAVVRGANGFHSVDCRKLGTRMTRLQ